MRVLIDSADQQAIVEALASGFVWGVTTNPTLLRRAAVRADEVPDLARLAFERGANEVHLQVYGSDTAQMLADAERLVDIDAGRVVVKIPATPQGYAAAAQLAARQVRVTLTAVYTLRQVVLAQSVGAEYVAVYLGRMRDGGLPSQAIVEQMQAAIRSQGSPVKLLAASVRDPSEVEALALAGVASVTLPITVLRGLLDSPATAQAAAAFADDSRAILDA